MFDLEAVARGLLTLQINTIVSDGISVERMPSDGRALIRIAQLYHEFLRRVIDEIRDAAGRVDGLPSVSLGTGPVTAFSEWDVRSGGMRTFELLHDAAVVCEVARARVPRPHAMRPEHDTILARVVGSCDQVKAALLRLHLANTAVTLAAMTLAEEEGITWPAFDGEMLLLLRRIWETGVDVVVMQTMVQLDGNLVTRVLDGWDAADAQVLHGIHYQAVDVSLNRWTLLVQTAREIAGFFLGVAPRPSPVQGAPSPASGAPVAGGV